MDVYGLRKVIHFQRGRFNPLSNRFDDLSKNNFGHSEISLQRTENEDYCLFLHQLKLKTRQHEDDEICYRRTLFATFSRDGIVRQTHPDDLCG
jgi:hypothetical protein